MYVVPVAKKSTKQDKFQFKIEDEVHEATRFDLLPTSFVESLADIPKENVTKALRLALAGDDEALAEKIGALPIKQTADLLKAWQREGAISLGE